MNDHAEYARLRDDQKGIVRTLAGILRIAIGLDRRHDARVKGVSVTRTPEGMKILVQAPPGTDLSLELYAASERSGLLSDVLGTPIILSDD
jgi:exopolyphosphatase / guanosine-5'-triphosphate,3'-diphosphate pyrophosphatase